MIMGFTVNPDGIGQAEKTLEEGGHAVNDVRNAVPAEPADAGASTAMLDLVVSQLFAGATALVDDRAETLSAMADCRATYLRTEDTATCGMETIMHTAPWLTPPHPSPCRGPCRG